MKTGTQPSNHESALRHQVETIVLAACKIKGMPIPDPTAMKTIVSRISELVGDQPASLLEQHVGFLAEQIGTNLSYRQTSG